MSLDKTLTDTYRRDLNFDKYSVYEALPGYFDDRYQNLITFLLEYYKSLEEDDNPVEKINDLLVSRDVTETKTELLSFIAKELLLGKSYFESFQDKRSALQFSNLLYRSKGTAFSIQQFFRTFYGLDIDVDYGKDRVFYIGDNPIDELVYLSSGQSSGKIFPYTYNDGTINVYVQNDAGEYIALRQDLEYTINFTQRSIELKPLEDINDALNSSDNSLSYLAETGYVLAGRSLKIITTRQGNTTIGSDLTDKRLTDDKFFQLYSILISTPVSVNVWKDAYKTFVHPAGIYLQGQVAITSVVSLKFGPQESIILPPPPIDIVEQANILKLGGTGLYSTDITELAVDSDGAEIRTRVNDLNHPFNVDNWHTQYPNLARADDINSRTLDDTFADMSNTINTLDENVY